MHSFGLNYRGAYKEGNKLGSMSGTCANSTISRRELSSSFFLQGKAPKKIHGILSFLVGLRTYQHPCVWMCHNVGKINIEFNNLSLTNFFPNWHFLLHEDGTLVFQHVGDTSLIFMYKKYCEFFWCNKLSTLNWKFHGLQKFKLSSLFHGLSQNPSSI